MRDDEAIGIAAGQRPKQHGVDDAQGRGGGTDPQPEREHGGGGQERRTGERADDLPERGHREGPETVMTLILTLVDGEGEGVYTSRTAAGDLRRAQ